MASKDFSFQILFELLYHKIKYDETPLNLNPAKIIVKQSECTQYNMYGKSVICNSGDIITFGPQQWTRDDQIFIKNYNIISYICQFTNPELDLQLQRCQSSQELKYLIEDYLYLLFQFEKKNDQQYENPRVIIDI